MVESFKSSREEVTEAISTIIQRIDQGQSTTAIVMPPRTGKSDVIRAGACEANKVFGGVVSVALSPWLFLRDQLINEGKVKQMCRRLKISRYMCGRLEAPFADDFYSARPWRDLWSMTVAGAAQEGSLIQLEQAATTLSELGKRLLVFIDEGHLVSSDQTGWGKVAARLEAATAHIVLLTGSQHRSDNIAPFGFRTKELHREDISYGTPGFGDDGNRVMHLYEAERVTYKLEADYHLSRRDAWEKGYLVPVQARWFSFYTNGQETSAVTDKAIARKALRKAVRDPSVIRQAAELLVDDVMTRRHTAPASAAIVFVGNDSQDEGEDDIHTNQVKNIIETVWRQKTGIAPTVVKAMQRGMKQEEAAKRIHQFVGSDEMPGVGDVLIVKQMGGVGLDAGRIKTALDLSIIRTSVAGIQRYLRIATPWADENGKSLATNGTLILPNDMFTQELYAYVVTQQGGDDLTSLTNKTWVDDKDVDDDDDIPPDLDISHPHDAGVSDLQLDYIGASKDEMVTRALRQQPKLALIYDRVEIARRLDNGQITITAEDAKDDDPVVAKNITDELEPLYETINKLTKAYADRKHNYYGEKDAWIHCRKMIFREAKLHAGHRGELRSCKDVPQLHQMIECLKNWVGAA